MSPMHVAIDATPLINTSGGLVRYVRELALALAAEFPDDKIILMSDQPFRVPEGAPRNLRAVVGGSGFLERRWWLCGAQKAILRVGANVFHGTNFVVPWLPLKPCVLTLHDLAPWRAESSGETSAFVHRRTPLQIGLGLAARIIVPTEAVRREAIERFGVHPSRIHAVPHAACSKFRPTAPWPHPKPYFFYVGDIVGRKNLMLVAEAFCEIRNRCDVDLLLAGPARFPKSLTQRPGVLELGEVADEQLAQLYTGAAACLHPSRYEGFGLPVLEAMQCGALVIAAGCPAVREVAGDGALLLEADNPKAWLNAMQQALDGAEYLKQVRQRALKRAAQYSWSKTARLTRQVYQKAYAGFWN